MPDKKLKIDLAYRPRLADLKPLNVPAALLAQQPQTLAAPRTTPASELKKRQGYAENFLGDFVVPWPAVDAELAADVYPLDNTGNRLD
ncbi:DNA/RNA non-specific endonuclease, partial [Pseudomonas syringae pv. actinidifoliorum]|nr:DNA/RNA non-specific endonuclease [Pseudomonas syringae pv. actinidifoliorum]